MGQLEGKISIITGGGTGIGLGIARAFVKEGAKVVLAARNIPRLEDADNELRELGGTQKGGRIINIGSISSRMPRMNSAPYTSSKHAVIGLTKSTALEGRPYGISAGALHPGNVEVEWRAKSTTSMDQESMMTPDDIAVAALAMAVLPPYVNMLDTTVLPVEQLYVGRG